MILPNEFFCRSSGLTSALSRAARRQHSIAARAPAGRREPAKGVGSSAMFGGVPTYSMVENSSRYWARPRKLPATCEFKMFTMNTSAGTSHSHVNPCAPADRNPNRG